MEFMRGKVKMTGAMGRFMAVLECIQGEPYRAALAKIAAATDGLTGRRVSRRAAGRGAGR